MIVANWVSDSKMGEQIPLALFLSNPDKYHAVGKRITKLEAEVERLKKNQLKPGEYVCRDVTCKECLGKKKYYNQYADREFKCNICNGTGLMPERVG